MFDSNPAASCAILNITKNFLKVTHFRVNYKIQDTKDGIEAAGLPMIYKLMYQLGQKLN